MNKKMWCDKLILFLMSFYYPLLFSKADNLYVKLIIYVKYLNF